MAVVNFIRDDLQYTDGQNLTSQAAWDAVTRTGSGVMQSDQHGHLPDQVIDMSTTGWGRAIYQADTLDSFDQRAQITFYPDTKYLAGNETARGGVILRAQDASATDIDAYEVRVTAYPGNDGVFGDMYVSIDKVVNGSSTTLISVSNYNEFDGRTYASGINQGAFERSGPIVVEGRINGTTIEAWVNGRFVTSTTDATYTTGSHVGFLQARITSGTYEQPFSQRFLAWTDTCTDQLFEDTPWLWYQIENHGSVSNPVSLAQTRNLNTTPTSGNTLLVMIGSEDDGNSTSPSWTITDSASGSWTLESSKSDTQAAVHIYSKVAAGTETSITVQPGEAARWNVVYMEVDSSTWSLEDSACNSAGGTTTSGTLSTDYKVGLGLVIRGDLADATQTTFDRALAHNVAQFAVTTTEPQQRFGIYGTTLGTATTAFSVVPNGITQSKTGYVILAKSSGPPTASASGTPADTADTASGTATSVSPSSATGTPSDTADTASGTATSVAPTSNGTGAAADTADTASGTATSAAATSNGTGAATDTADTASGTATSVAPTSNGTGAATDTADTASGTATSVAPTSTGSAAATDLVDTASGTATSVAPTSNGTGAAADTADTASGTATSVAPVSTGSGAASDTVDTASGTATTGTPAATASGTPSDATDTASGTATSVAPTFNGTGAATDTVDTASGTATSVAPVSTGSGTATDTVDTASGTATSVAPTSNGTGAASDGADTASGTATSVAPVASATGTGAATEAGGDTAVAVAPTPLKVIAVAHNQVDLEWGTYAGPGAPAVRYEIWRDGGYLNEVTAPNTTFSDTSTGQLTEYDYYVRPVLG